MAPTIYAFILLFIISSVFGSTIFDAFVSTLQRKLGLPSTATSILQQNLDGVEDNYDDFGTDIPVYFTDIRSGLPTCDPLGSHKEHPYSGYRFSYEVRIPYRDFTQRNSDGKLKLDINALNYANLVRSEYPKSFVMSTCDNSFVKGEIVVPVATIGQDVWNLTFCSDYIPTDNLVRTDSHSPPKIKLKYDAVKLEQLYQQSRLAKFSSSSTDSSPNQDDAHNANINNSGGIQEILIPHPFYDMFLNRRLQLADPYEPDVRPQYCFHVSKAREFKHHQDITKKYTMVKAMNSSSFDNYDSTSFEEKEELARNLTPQWNDFVLRHGNFVGAMYQCVDNRESALALGMAKISSKKFWEKQEKQGDKTEETYDANGMVCTRENMRPVMPLLRDSTESLWAVLVPKFGSDGRNDENYVKNEEKSSQANQDIKENEGLHKRGITNFIKSKLGSVLMNKANPVVRMKKMMKDSRDNLGNEEDIEDVEEQRLEFVVRVPWLYTPDIFDAGYPNLVVSNGGYLYYDQDHYDKQSHGGAKSMSLKRNKHKKTTKYESFVDRFWTETTDTHLTLNKKGQKLFEEELKKLASSQGVWQETGNKELLISQMGGLGKMRTLSGLSIKRRKRQHKFLSRSRTRMWHKWIKSVDPLEEYGDEEQEE